MSAPKMIFCPNNMRVYASAVEASKELGVSPVLICKTLRGKTTSAKRYLFTYVSGDENLPALREKMLFDTYKIIL